ncbi:MAG: tripartite tricarboxylate transporter substrate binding protein [Betaproteobacteria bacterium]|nr:tripartite tricarboxylate transporter substrate binding protein [Betaproteobacteria bacterium]
MSVFRHYAGAIATSFLLISPLTTDAMAQAYPAKPVRMVLPFPAGAPSDIVGRAIGQKLSEQVGQNFIPDNRAGAGGNLALGMIASAAPDGYTVVVTSPTIAISPSLYSKLSYNAFKDLAPVARLATIENVLVVHPSVPAKTLKQFVALARSRPGVLNYGSGGAGTTNHLANELLKHLEKINMVHVPYKGATLATVAAISGEVDEVIVSVASALSLIKQGKVRPLAVLSEKRVATLPNVPTSKEAGVDGFQMSIWYGMFAPAGTPREIIARLNQEVFKALESKEMQQRMAAMSINPWPGTPEQMEELLRTETARYAAIIKSAGLRPQ